MACRADDGDEERASDVVQRAIERGDVVYVDRVKFRNQIIQRGSSVKLLVEDSEDEQKKKFGYGFVTSIAKVQREEEVNFPMVKIAWYYTRDEDMVYSHRDTLFPKELVLSDYEDWVYFETVKEVVKVHEWREVSLMSTLDKKTTLFCRSWVDNGRVTFERAGTCYCGQPEGPVPMRFCCVCERVFHSRCMGGPPELPVCFMCSSTMI